MFPIQDQISVATKANIEANLALYTSLTHKTLESVEKLFNLNVAAVRASMEESQAVARQILTAKDPQEFLSAVTAQAKPNLEKAIAYGSHLTSIANSAQAEFNKAAESQIAQFNRKISDLVEEAAQKAPAGSENILTIMKTAMGNASSAYEQMTKTVKQATEAMEATVNSAASKVAQSVVVKS